MSAFRSTSFLALFALTLAVLSSGCFGRSSVVGLGLADGAEGEECRQDGHCQLGLLCINSRCTRLGPASTADVSVDLADDAGLPECPGLVGEVVLGEVVTGSTQGSSNRYQGTCGGGEAPDEVWLLRLSSASSVVITTESSQYDTVLYLRDGCDGEATELACNDDDRSTGGLHSRIEIVNLPAGSYYLFVDGFGTHAGSYQLAVNR
ncbi:MAG: PPC domain-containing protein [Bradymonadales bacterium]|nr:PPC domain-containing protein [Bradymonadales bacterium]